jgi:hypothetical protein
VLQFRLTIILAFKCYNNCYGNCIYTIRETKYKEDMGVLVIIRNKAGFARGIQGTESLWLDSRLSVVWIPPVMEPWE